LGGWVGFFLDRMCFFFLLEKDGSFEGGGAFIGYWIGI
jgi:hypothetical protein